MPNDPYASKELLKTNVAIKSGNLTYVFQGNVVASVKTDLGITDFVPPANMTAAVALTGHVHKCSYPKPRRATKTDATGSDSSFLSSTISPAPSGYEIGKGAKTKKIFLPSGNAKVVSVFVEILGIKYAWNMPKWQYIAIGAERSGLGIENCDENDIDDYVWGASLPKPARVSKIIAGVGGSDRITTFCGKYTSGITVGTLPAGWFVSAPAKTFFELR